MTAVLNPSLGRILGLAPQGQRRGNCPRPVKEVGIVWKSVSTFRFRAGAWRRHLLCRRNGGGASLRRLAHRSVACERSAHMVGLAIHYPDPACRRRGPQFGSRKIVRLARQRHVPRAAIPSTTFISVARTALKGRQRQYEARGRIELLHEGEERLRTALLAGRLGSWELDIAARTLTASATFKALFGRARIITFLGRI